VLAAPPDEAPAASAGGLLRLLGLSREEALACGQPGTHARWLAADALAPLPAQRLEAGLYARAGAAAGLLPRLPTGEGVGSAQRLELLLAALFERRQPGTPVGGCLRVAAEALEAYAPWHWSRALLPDAAALAARAGQLAARALEAAAPLQPSDAASGLAAAAAACTLSALASWGWLPSPEDAASARQVLLSACRLCEAARPPCRRALAALLYASPATADAPALLELLRLREDFEAQSLALNRVLAHQPQLLAALLGASAAFQPEAAGRALELASDATALGHRGQNDGDKRPKKTQLCITASPHPG